MRVAIVLSLLLLIVGASYQYLAEASDKQRASGEFITVGEHEYHLWCMGKKQENKPTVLLLNGLWANHPDWQTVMEGVALHGKICSYDRLGTGWSSAKNKPARAIDIAQNLEALRAAAQLDGPIILAGFSAGGLYARQYQRDYPKDVVGMVLVDSAHEQAELRMNLPSYDLGVVRLCAAIAWTGIIRALDILEEDVPASFMPERARQQLAVFNRSGFCAGLPKQTQGFLLDTAATTPSSLGDLPLTVISAGIPLSEQTLNTALSKEELAEHARVWPQLQRELASLSSNAQHWIAEQSGHGIPVEQPQIIVKAIVEQLSALTSK